MLTVLPTPLLTNGFLDVVCNVKLQLYVKWLNW